MFENIFLFNFVNEIFKSFELLYLNAPTSTYTSPPYTSSAPQ